MSQRVIRGYLSSSLKSMYQKQGRLRQFWLAIELMGSGLASCHYSIAEAGEPQNSRINIGSLKFQLA